MEAPLCEEPQVEESRVEEQHVEEQKASLIHRISNYLIENSPGMRVVKTALAVLICLLIEYFRGSTMPYHACIATIVCMQPTLKSTVKAATDRNYRNNYRGHLRLPSGYPLDQQSRNDTREFAVLPVDRRAFFSIDDFDGYHQKNRITSNYSDRFPGYYAKC